MRVLLVSGTFPPMPCGVGDYTAHLATALGRRKDVRAGVLTSRGAVAPVTGDVEVLPLVETWRIREAPRIAGCIRRFSPDVVHVQYPTHEYRAVQWILPAIARLANGPVVQTWHEYYSPRNWPSVLNAAMPGGLVVVRPSYLEKMPNWYRSLLRGKEFRFIPNASSIPTVLLPETDRRSIRTAYNAADSNLLAFFGFASPSKGIETLFDIADPAAHRIVLICDLRSDDPYHQDILRKIESREWAGKVFVTGFIPPGEVGRILAASDAVVFPFRDGGGLWNSSLHGAVAQGTFVLTTSRDRQGYDPDMNVFYSPPGNIQAMRQALRDHLGRKKIVDTPARDPWDDIAEAHVELYRTLLSRIRPSTRADGKQRQ